MHCLTLKSAITRDRRQCGAGMDEWGNIRKLQAVLGTLSVAKNYIEYISKGYKKDGEFSK